MIYYYFIAGTIGLSTGNVVTNTEISLPAPIDSYTTIKEIERGLAVEFNAPSFIITFYNLLRTE
jgi:hypothetical protein